MNTPRHTCLHCTETATFKIFITSDPGDFNDADNCQVYTCDTHLNMELTSNYGYVISTYESPNGFSKINGKVIEMNKTARATLARKRAARIAYYIRQNEPKLADIALDEYYWLFGATKGYRHMLREVTYAFHKYSKEVK